MSHSMFQVVEYQAARAAAPAEFAAAEALNVWADGQRAQADGQPVTIGVNAYIPAGGAS